MSASFFLSPIDYFSNRVAVLSAAGQTGNASAIATARLATKMNTSIMKKSSEPKAPRIGDLIVYKNNQLLGLNKPSGMPVQPDQSGNTSLFDLAEIYVKSALYPLHRIDRPASGIVLFAKTETAVQGLNAQFQERAVEKVYWAVVGEVPPTLSDRLIHYLRKDGRANKSRVYDRPTEGAQEAILSYRTKVSLDNYHLLEVQIETGRHHQIRAQLAAIGSPIKGDVKYGARRANRDKSIHLHARSIRFRHPVSEEQIYLQAEPPLTDPIWKAVIEKLQ